MSFGSKRFRGCVEGIQVYILIAGLVDLFIKFSIELFRDTVTHLDNSNIAFEKRGKLEKDAQIMIKMLQKQEDQIAKFKMLNLKNKKADVAVLGLNGSVEFDYNNNEGRFAKARKDIKIGDEILVENPHCVMLLEKFSKSHCQNCFKR